MPSVVSTYGTYFTISSLFAFVGYVHAQTAPTSTLVKLHWQSITVPSETWAGLIQGNQKAGAGGIQLVSIGPADWQKMGSLFKNQSSVDNSRAVLGSDVTDRASASGTRAWITKHDPSLMEPTSPGFTPVLNDGRNIALVPTIKADGKILLRVEIWDQSGTPLGATSISAKVIEREVSNGDYLLINLNEGAIGTTDNLYAVRASI